MSMTPEQARAAWVKALRSGKYVQTAGALHKRHNGEDRFCCLGVACEVYNVLHPDDPIPTYVASISDSFIGPAVEMFSYDGNTAALPEDVQNWLGLRQNNGEFSNFDSLADRNDQGATFGTIADIIEQGRGNLING